MKEFIKDNERIDDLQYKNLKIIQKKDGFCFGVDAVLLADFASVRKNARVMDFGTGTGIIALLIAAKTHAREIYGIEIQKDIADMAKRSVEMNGLEDKIKIVCGDIKDAPKEFGIASFDYIVSNPPYIIKNGGIVNPSDAKAISRHEIKCTLEDIIRSASEILVPRGKFAMIHKPYRLADIIYLLRNSGLEPKKIRFVHPKPSKEPTMVLVEAAKGEGPNTIVLPPLFIRNENGDEYSDELKFIYDGMGEM